MRCFVMFTSAAFFLSALPLYGGPTNKVEAKNLVANGDFEEGGAGDPWIPAGWSNGEGDAGFAPGELTVNTDRPILGTKSLEINTLGGGDRTRVVYTRIMVTPGMRHEISYRARQRGDHAERGALQRPDVLSGGRSDRPGQGVGSIALQ